MCMRARGKYVFCNEQAQRGNRLMRVGEGMGGEGWGGGGGGLGEGKG